MRGMPPLARLLRPWTLSVHCPTSCWNFVTCVVQVVFEEEEGLASPLTEENFQNVCKKASLREGRYSECLLLRPLAVSPSAYAPW